MSFTLELNSNLTSNAIHARLNLVLIDVED
jgi:hypothetical protein